MFLSIRFTYQAVVRPGAGTRDERDNKPLVILEADSPPILVHPSHLGGELSAGQVFNIGVRLKTKQVRYLLLFAKPNVNLMIQLQGLYSEIGDTEIFEVQPDAFQSVAQTSSSSAMLFLFSLLVIAALGGTVMFLIQRHRRLQNSFSRFANSHYDTKTGATRIGDALEDDDHQEVPPRFADDEPLVIA